MTLRMLIFFSLLAPLAASAGAAEFDPEQTLRAADAVLRSLMAHPGLAIPADVFTRAQGLLIIPAVKRVKAVVGATTAHGVVLARDENGDWGIPQFVLFKERNLGVQAGNSSTDVIQVFMTRDITNRHLASSLGLTVGSYARFPTKADGIFHKLQKARNAKSDIRRYPHVEGAEISPLSVGTISWKLDEAAQSAYYGGGSAGESGSLPVGASALLATVNGFSRPAPEAHVERLPTSAAVTARRPQTTPQR